MLVENIFAGNAMNSRRTSAVSLPRPTIANDPALICPQVRDKPTGGTFVLKMVLLAGLDEAHRTTALNEGAVMAQLGPHPNLIGHHRSFVEDERLYIVMEHAAGGDLEQHIRTAASHSPPHYFSEDVVWTMLPVVILQISKQRTFLD